jgi:hypothetical protein
MTSLPDLSFYFLVINILAGVNFRLLLRFACRTVAGNISIALVITKLLGSSSDLE